MIDMIVGFLFGVVVGMSAFTLGAIFLVGLKERGYKDREEPDPRDGYTDW